MLSLFFELDRQNDVEEKYPKLLKVDAVIGTDKRDGKCKYKHKYLLCILECAERMKRAEMYLGSK
jgi:hypothetical protein